jgi:hypothetical protein
MFSRVDNCQNGRFCFVCLGPVCRQDAQLWRLVVIIGCYLVRNTLKRTYQTEEYNSSLVFLSFFFGLPS